MKKRTSYRVPLLQPWRERQRKAEKDGKRAREKLKTKAPLEA